jgi:hypothetical protein
MRGLPSVSTGERQRARRWDAIVLGSSLPGLVASVRLAMHGARVLVLEEDASREIFTGLREPFLVTGADAGSVLGACMQAMGMALIDRRRLESGPLAYQVVLPDARLDFGEPTNTIRELVAWGLADAENARRLVRALGAAAEAERSAILVTASAAGARRPGKPGRAAAPAPPHLPRPPAPHSRGFPAEASLAGGRLAAMLGGQLRALSNLAASTPPPEAASRLLGLGLEGGVGDSQPDTWLRPLLRRRVESLFGEFRTVSGRFRLVNAAKEPGVLLADGNELLVGRSLLLNAPHASLVRALDDPPPELARLAPATRRRLGVHFQVPREWVPEGMGPRVVCLGRSSLPLEGTDVVTIRTWRGARKDDPLDVVASAVVAADEPDLPAREAEIEAAVTGLMPFSRGRLVRKRAPTPTWDDDALLTDPTPGSAWPADPQIRLSNRPPIYGLERGGAAALGFEGDLMLGWRSGDAIAGEIG